METTTNNILIIGATSGIGYRLWQHYVSEGHNVAVIGRRKEVLDKMQKDFPEQTFPICCDISDLSAINELFRNIPEIFSNIDIAIVCAGVGELNRNLILIPNYPLYQLMCRVGPKWWQHSISYLNDNSQGNL